MNSKQLIITIVLLVVVGAGSFYGGTMYEKSKASNPSYAQGRLGGAGGQGGFYRRFGGQGGAGQNVSAVRGKITSTGNNSITVQMQDGSSKIILFSNSTNISKAATGSSTDLTTGTEVMAGGTNNSDGSVTAQFIQINPITMMRGGGTPQPTQ